MAEAPALPRRVKDNTFEDSIMLRHHHSMYRLLPLVTLLLALAAFPAHGADNASAERRMTQIELSSEASVMATNDLAQATVFAEAAGPTPGGATAQKVKQQIEAALAVAKKYPQVAVRSGGLSTSPDYGSGKFSSSSNSKSWRVRSELLLAASDIEALSALVGELQETLGVADLRLLPTVETRKKAENEAILKAMTAFQERAALMAGAMGKQYRITKMVLNNGPELVSRDQRNGMMAMRAATENSPMPIEAGESQIKVTISGTIELLN